MTPRTATIGNSQIRWLEQDGDGTPIVLVHGIPTSLLDGHTRAEPGPQVRQRLSASSSTAP